VAAGNEHPRTGWSLDAAHWRRPLNGRTQRWVTTREAVRTILTKELPARAIQVRGNPGQGNPGQGNPDEGNPGQRDPGEENLGQAKPLQDNPGPG